jgi:hypothetical protein
VLAGGFNACAGFVKGAGGAGGDGVGAGGAGGVADVRWCVADDTGGIDDATLLLTSGNTGDTNNVTDVTANRGDNAVTE